MGMSNYTIIIFLIKNVIKQLIIRILTSVKGEWSSRLIYGLEVGTFLLLPRLRCLPSPWGEITSTCQGLRAKAPTSAVTALYNTVV